MGKEGTDDRWRETTGDGTMGSETATICAFYLIIVILPYI